MSCSIALSQDFDCYRNTLDHSYGKHEKIYKLSRDLTRESKKIICSLHQLPGAVEQAAGLEAADTALLQLRDTVIAAIADLLYQEPPYKYTTAFSSGMEEYVEALLFFSFMRRGAFLSFHDTRDYIMQAAATHDHEAGAASQQQQLRLGGPDSHPAAESSAHSIIQERLPVVPAPQPHHRHQLLSYDTYLLGLSDVAGELMRFYIKSVAVGETVQAAGVVSCLRRMKSGYASLGNDISKTMSHKRTVLEQSLAKVENISYNLSLRRTEFQSEPLQDLMQAEGPDDHVLQGY